MATKYFNTLVLATSLVFISAVAPAQSALSFTSEDKNVRFYIMIGDQQLNNFYETHVQLQNIPSGFHKVRIVFEADTVADYWKNVSVRNNQHKTFLISEKPGWKLNANQSGRNFGEKHDIGQHDSKFSYLVDIYHFQQSAAESFSPTGNELVISTEKSISTSPLPASKKAQE
jgi:hypothetical protein